MTSSPEFLHQSSIDFRSERVPETTHQATTCHSSRFFLNIQYCKGCTLNTWCIIVKINIHDWGFGLVTSCFILSILSSCDLVLLFHFLSLSFYAPFFPAPFSLISCVPLVTHSCLFNCSLLPRPWLFLIYSLWLSGFSSVPANYKQTHYILTMLRVENAYVELNMYVTLCSYPLTEVT